MIGDRSNVPVDQFIMLDVDVIVHQDLAPILSEFINADLIYFDRSVGQSYRTVPNTFCSPVEINSGTFVSSRLRFSFEDIADTIEENMDLYKSTAFLENDDQPMLNFSIDTLNKAAICIDKTRFGFSGNTWYGLPFLEVDNFDGTIKDLSNNRQVALTHFAGLGSALHKAPRFGMIYQAYLESAANRLSIDIGKLI